MSPPLPRPRLLRRSLDALALLVLAVLTVLMLRIVRSYWPWQPDTGFLILKQEVVDQTLWRWSFWGHVLTSVLVLPAGFSQFSGTLRQRWPQWHRRLGHLYVVSVLILAAPTGLVLGWSASGGWGVQVCFLLLGLVWIVSTLQAVRCAQQRRWADHRAWMIRSYALALSALSLRTWKLVLYEFAPVWPWLTPLHIYQLEAWLGWTVNLLVAEWIIRGGGSGPSHHQ